MRMLNLYLYIGRGLRDLFVTFAHERNNEKCEIKSSIEFSKKSILGFETLLIYVHSLTIQDKNKQYLRGQLKK